MDGARHYACDNFVPVLEAKVREIGLDGSLQSAGASKYCAMVHL